MKKAARIIGIIVLVIVIFAAIIASINNGWGRLWRVLQDLKRVVQKENMVRIQSRGAALGAKHLPRISSLSHPSCSPSTWE